MSSKIMMNESSPANLLEQLDKKIMVWLRDGRTLIGYLRSIDQFANLVLHQAIERIHVRNDYGDISRGVFIIRGENVALLGEVDVLKEPSKSLKEIPVSEILQKQEIEQNTKIVKERLLTNAFWKKGIVYTAGDNSLELL